MTEERWARLKEVTWFAKEQIEVMEYVEELKVELEKLKVEFQESDIE